MWSELDDNDKEIYKRLILAYASLSEAFAQKEDFSSGSKKKGVTSNTKIRKV